MCHSKRIALLISICFNVATLGEGARETATLGTGSRATHRFSPYEAEVTWTPSQAHRQQQPSSLRQVSSTIAERPVRIMHITDNHISIDDPSPPLTTRMFNAFMETSDHTTQRSTTPEKEFTALLQKAKREQVDLIALGGDLINYPSQKTVAWVQQQLHDEAGGIPYIYTAGNHDWHEEGVAADKRYDSARFTQLNATLKPLFEGSAAAAGGAVGTGAGRLYGKTSVRGVDVMFVDNSNHQVNEEQLHYLQEQLQQSSATPAVLLMHMPLKLKGTPPNLEPKYLCGHPDWGAATDQLYEVERRPRWPEQGNSASTLSFIELVKRHSAPAGRLAAMLTGHVHKDFSATLQDGSLPYAANLTALSCRHDGPDCELHTPKHDGGGTAEAVGALQYTTLDAAEGGYRLLTIRRTEPGSSVHTASHRLDTEDRKMRKTAVVERQGVL